MMLYLVPACYTLYNLRDTCTFYVGYPFIPFQREEYWSRPIAHDHLASSQNYQRFGNQYEGMMGLGLQCSRLFFYCYYSNNSGVLLMQAGQFQKYQEVSKLFKEIVDSVTTLEIGQLKLFFVNLEKRINAKATSVFQDFTSLLGLLDNLKEAKGKVALHFAVARGDVEVVRHMIEVLKVDHSLKDKDGNSGFLTAVEHGHLDLVKYFIEQLNYSPNEIKQGQISTLHIAANHNHTQVIAYLLTKGADIERVSIYGKPINWAVGNRHFEATQLLLENGADANGDATGTTIAPLILAVDFKDKVLYDLLLSRGANPNTKDPSGFSVLHVAAQKGDLQFVKDLVEKGADYRLEVQGKSPLYLAFENSKWDVVNYLKQKSPDHQKVEQRIKQQLQKQQKSKVQPNKQKAQQIKLQGNKLYSQKKYQQALDEYHRALQYDVQNQVIHRNIAACYLPLNQYQLALFHCQQAKKKDSKNVKTVYREAQANIGLGNLIDATSNMWECSMIEPSNTFFRSEFLRLFNEAKTKHKQAETAHAQ